MHDVGLRRVAVADGGDITHRPCAVGGLDRRSPSSSIFSGELLSCTVYSNEPIFIAPTGVIRFCAASVLATSRPDRPSARSAVGLSRSGSTAVCRHRDRGSPRRERDQRRAQLVDADISEVLFGQAFARQRELDDRDRGGVVIQDQRRRGTGRKLLEQRLRDRGDLGVRGPDIDIGLEEDLDDADAVIGVRDDMRDALTVVVRARSNGVVMRPDI